MSAVADHMSSRDYEREAEASRHRLAGGLRELSDRLSPGSIMDEVLGYAKGGGGTVLTAFSNAARDNPVPSLLIGAGLLMFLSEKTGIGHAMRGHGADSYDRTYRGSYDDRGFYDNPQPDRGHAANGNAHRFGDAVSGAAHSVSSAAHSAADGVRNASGRAMSGVRQGAAGVGAAVAGAADAARSGVMGAADAARSGVMGAAEGARSAMAGAAGVAAGTADHLMHGARDFGGAVGHAGAVIGDRIAGTAREAPRRVSDSVTHTRDSLMSLIAEQPLIAGALGLAIGAVIAAALPKTEAEDQLMGEASDTIKQAVGEIAGDEMEIAKSVAANLASEVGRMAGEQGMSTEGAVAAVHAATDKLAEAVGIKKDDPSTDEDSAEESRRGSRA